MDDFIMVSNDVLYGQVSPAFLEIIHDEAAVTVMRRVLAAQEATAGQ